MPTVRRAILNHLCGAQQSSRRQGAVERGGGGDGNGYPPPVYPQVKNLIRVRVWGNLPPTGLLMGENPHPSGEAGAGAFLSTP
jgi:hypothetical protein